MTTATRAAVLLAPLLLVGGMLGLLAADAPKDDAKADVLCPKGDAQFGSRACAACHNIDPLQPDTAKEHAYAGLKSHEFVLLSEGKTYRRHDPHQLAFEALTSKLGTQMGKALGYDVSVDARCLTCHATDLMAGESLHPDAAKAPPHERFNTSDGVGCVGCHGVRKEWQTAHYEEPTVKGGPLPWRDKLTPKKAEAGMRDLRNPATKANLCASCHVGSDDLKRVVTHDMYAAGHPPLPPFELLTFQEGEPRHWERPANLPAVAGYTGDAWKQFHYQPDETAGREYAAGAIAALKAEAGMLAADAERLKTARENGAGIDFARFECSSCHHDLKFPSDRPVKNPPGRPPLRNSIGVPALVAAEHAGAKEFAAKWEALKKAATARPFGGDAVASEAAAVRAECEALLAKLGTDANPKYDAKRTEALRAAVGKAAAESAGDPEAALVLAWGYLALGGELPADKLAEFEKVLPPGVRKPFEKKKGDEDKPAAINYADRQKKLNELKADDFRKALEGLK